MTQNHTIPERSQIKTEDKWDLSSLFCSDSDWDKAFNDLEDLIPEIGRFRNTLGDSAERLKECLNLIINRIELPEERLGYYVMLRREENIADSETQGRYNRFIGLSSRIAAEKSFIEPEIMAVPDGKMKEFLRSGILDEYSIYLNKMLRFKPHILSDREEALLARQAEFSQTANKAFSALTNVDMSFGSVKTEKGEIPLSQTTFSLFLLDKSREVRKTAYQRFYEVFDGHRHTLGELYSGSIMQDIYQARVRGYQGSRQAALFPDNVPESVYGSLITAVRNSLPALHRYYGFRKRKLGLEELRHYDVYVSLIPDMESSVPYDKAVGTVCEALSPLGEEYVSVLKRGLVKDRWVDRYENKGKRAGAFSAGSFTGKPYILMNYRDDDIRHVFTLVHEAGHSMHSWYSASRNPFQHYNYTIFEAETASTFNEQLLADYLLKNAKNDGERAYLVGKQVNDIIATIYRQTMFAEYEHIVHKLAEEGTPLTLDLLTGEYRRLLEAYFGPDMVFEENSALEGLRIPHFYRAFYVYKYATGLAAAIALSRRVLGGGERERSDYLEFLSSGGSRFPLDSLKKAGVDMSSPGPVNDALDHFAVLVRELERY